MNTNSNVTPIESKQPQVAARFTITATLEGFPFTVEAEGKAEDLRALVGRLKAIGAQPPTIARPEPTKAESEDSTPTCPRHHSFMRSGRKGWFCPKKVGEGYCKETA